MEQRCGMSVVDGRDMETNSIGVNIAAFWTSAFWETFLSTSLALTRERLCPLVHWTLIAVNTTDRQLQGLLADHDHQQFAAGKVAATTQIMVYHKLICQSQCDVKPL